jgi:hypothetical protein
MIGNLHRPMPRQNRGAERAKGDTGPFLGAIVESFVLLLLLEAAEILFFGDRYFASLAQHPFWIVVLLAALQHGLFAGVATAGLAALMMDWPPRPVDVDITAHYLEVAILPLQWLAAALCIGLFRQTQIRDQRRLQAEKASLEEINEALAAEVSRLDDEVEGFELEAVTRQGGGASVAGLLAGLGALHDASQEELIARFNDAAALCSRMPTRLLLRVGDQGFVDSSGLPPLAGLEATLDPLHPLVACADQVAGAVPVSFEMSEGTPPQDLILSGVRLDDQGGTLAGIIIVAVESADGRAAEEDAAVPAVDLLASATAFALSRASSEAPAEPTQPQMRLVSNG